MKPLNLTTILCYKHAPQQLCTQTGKSFTQNTAKIHHLLLLLYFQLFLISQFFSSYYTLACVTKSEVRELTKPTFI